MALTVGEDSYVSLADADSYWTDHDGGTNWATASDTEKEKALRAATQVIDKSYNWIGRHPGSNEQLLAWPRNNAYDKEGRVRSGIPQEIKDATAWLAEEALAGQLIPVKDRGGKVKNLKAGSVEIEYEDGAPAHKQFDYVDMLVKNLVSGTKSASIMKKV